MIHLDDFGTGTFRFLNSPGSIDAVKSDQLSSEISISNRCRNPGSRLSRAQALNLQVIAEGVENAKEDAFLTKNGVNERQGFLFAKPMPAVSFERWHKTLSDEKCVLMAAIIGRTAQQTGIAPIFPFSFQINFCIIMN